jgi:predicted phage gp36 major capsid-like protein
LASASKRREAATAEQANQGASASWMEFGKSHTPARRAAVAALPYILFQQYQASIKFFASSITIKIS